MKWLAAVLLLLPLSATALWELESPFVVTDDSSYIDTGVDLKTFIRDDWTLRATVTFDGSIEDRRHLLWGYGKTPWDRTEMLHVANERDGRLRINVGGFSDALYMPSRELFTSPDSELLITQAGREWRVAVDGVLVYAGTVPELGPFSDGNTLTLGGAPTVSESWMGTIHSASLQAGADDDVVSEELEVKRFTWAAPATREDGELLGANEIGGYRLGCSMVSGQYADWQIDLPATPTAHEEPELTFAEGTHYCAMQAVDTGNRRSAWSAEVAFVVEPDGVDPPIIEPPAPPSDVTVIRITITIEVDGEARLEISP
jgi:hypothetical protein